MTTETSHQPSRREILADLMSRLARVQAAGGTLKSFADSNHTGAATLADALESLQRDLLLAAREAEAARARIVR
jgi:hypothetical protein